MRRAISFLRKLYSGHVVSAIIISVFAILVVPTLAAFAYSVAQTGDDWVVNGVDKTSFFYRTRDGADDTDLSYGYGYGYVTDAGQFGYGYGYAYGYFNSNATNWSNGDVRLGFFTAASGVPLAATLDIGTPTASGSTAAITTAFPLTIGTADSATVEVHIPNGVTITADDASWDGSLAAAYATTVPATVSIASGAIVSMTGPAGNVALDDEAIVKVPYASFDTTTNAVVYIVAYDTSPYLVAECTSTQYTGSATSDSALTTSSNYDVGAGGHCYNYYSNFVYIATRHFSDFIAGVSSTASSSGTGALVTGDLGGGGGGGGGGADDETVEVEDEDGEKVSIELTDLEMEDYGDLSVLEATTWEYEVVNTVLGLGLFAGEYDADGVLVFNMYNTMNRAQAAQVLGRHYSCDLDTDPSESPFVDVATDVWYAPAVECLKEVGAVGGKTDGSFDPVGTVTRAEFFKMLVEIHLAQNPNLADSWTELMEGDSMPFADVSEGDWYAGYMRLAADLKLLSGYSEGGEVLMKGNKEIFRVEGASMVVKFVEL
jgi:competence protein ComGC